MSKNGMAYDTGMPKVASARTPIDVIATYMNSSDTRLNNKGAATDHGGHLSMRHSESAQAHFSPIPQPASAPASLQRKRSNSITHHALSRDSSAEWGWFADIDSSGESFGDNSITSLLRRKFSIDSGGGNEHIIHDEQHSTSRMTAALKTFPGDSGDKVQTAAVSIPKFRIVQSRAGADRHAEYLVTFKLDYNDQTNRFNRLEPSYLHNKCIALEVFLRDLMYELTVPDVLIDFIGERAINCKPLDASGGRPSAQLPKEMRPKQPQEERELFEKLWAENFARSAVNYDESQARPSGSAPV
ncbi:hypothetical protein DYB30_008341 [Aphanomyces astaci]|uniref:PX domain-containing protein n=1 Tax=Aphanomyces astaci TaxID=112090 RepID=A0A397E209_APHAT|nr:hypothetical protein DYB36_004829 [Aphanomyces astaci]RHY48467.1 hypothetical protein DYB34_006183 [Aphanomyces astaci]RHY65118.1 hypothetical protein DYB38_010928 [Aphanomyces astaci]RHY72406.1 hypothetical protein DYB30_008341 [Aphanomyces astaci]RHY83262.1 hypothetical protein DYB26_011854 [Aphanomyces astaci]